MVDYLNRWCIEHIKDKNAQPKPIQVRDLISVPTFVLLADPGMGKTSVFSALAHERDIPCITANQLFTNARTVQSQELLIDAFDEARDVSDASLLLSINRTILEHNLKLIGLSCRIADWRNNASNLSNYISLPRVFELLPLDKQQQLQLLKQHPDCQNLTDPEGFLEHATTNGLTDFLGNPQSLLMLVAALKSNNNQLPNSRRDIYDLACRQLIREHNENHSQTTTEADLMRAAGWLSSVSLLSNTSQMAIHPTHGQHAQTMLLTELPQPEPPFSSDTIEEVIKSRICHKTNDCFEFIHRSVAEYLAARYLSELVNTHQLAAARVTSLLLSNGYLISNLRGLAGWLATLCHPLRQAIFTADPEAILDYSDLMLLDASSKQLLIKSLANDSKFDYRRHPWDSRNQYLPLTDNDMQDFCVDWLLTHSQITTNRTHLVISDILLNVLELQPTNHFWTDSLNTIILHTNTADSSRKRAFQAWLKHETSTEAQLHMLDQIHQNSNIDPEQALLDILIEALYPQTIAPSQIFNYWGKSRSMKKHVSSWRFWSTELNKNTPDSLVIELLNAFQADISSGKYSENFGTDLEYFDSGAAPKALSKITLRAIEKFGEQVERQQISNWLLWFQSHITPLLSLDKDGQVWLHNWQQERPELMKSIIIERLSHGSKLYNVDNLVLPPQMGTFWLEQCKHFMSLNNFNAAQFCFQRAFNTWEKDPSEMTLESIEAMMQAHPSLQETWNSRTISPLEDNWQREHYLNDRKYQKLHNAREKHHQDNLNFLLDNLDTLALAENRYLQFLEQAAWLYMEDDGYIGGEQKITEWLDTHQDLKQATEKGFLSLLENLSDQTIIDVLKAHQSDKRYLLELPCRVAARQLFECDPSAFWTLGEERLTAVLTLEMFGNSAKNDWIWAIAMHHPQWWVNAWCRMVREVALKKKEIRLPFIEHLRDDVTLKTLAPQTLPIALENWPSKPLKKNATTLRSLLRSSLSTLEKEALSELIHKHLQKSSLNTWQRSYFLMAGLWCHEQSFIEDITSALTIPAMRKSMFEFVGSFDWHRYEQLPNWTPATLANLYLWFAPQTSPIRPEGTHLVTAAHEVRDFLNRVAQRLEQIMTDEAQQAFKRLLDEPSIQAWHDHLTRQAAHHAHALAESRYLTPTSVIVANTLTNQAPSNHNDLMAIALEQLEQLQSEINNSPTNIKNRFWTPTKYSKPQPPHQPENDCRDIIAEWLTPRLTAQEITRIPENTQGDGKRTDIMLSHKPIGRPEIKLPIEIKGDWHDKLWTAAYSQLYQQYCTEMACAGRGIYLVLWMGSNRGNRDKLEKHPSIALIETPECLKEILQAEIDAKVPAGDIQVVVLDLSLPT